MNPDPSLDPLASSEARLRDAGAGPDSRLALVAEPLFGSSALLGPMARADGWFCVAEADTGEAGIGGATSSQTVTSTSRSSTSVRTRSTTEPGVSQGAIRKLIRAEAWVGRTFSFTPASKTVGAVVVRTRDPVRGSAPRAHATTGSRSQRFVASMRVPGSM
jgi:hypothetical protein